MLCMEWESLPIYFYVYALQSCRRNENSLSENIRSEQVTDKVYFEMHLHIWIYLILKFRPDCYEVIGDFNTFKSWIFYYDVILRRNVSEVNDLSLISVLKRSASGMCTKFWPTNQYYSSSKFNVSVAWIITRGRKK